MADRAMRLTDEEFRLFSTLIYDESGIVIREGKREFLQSRLLTRLQATQLHSYCRYKFISDKTEGQRELLDLMESLTINETSFFRNKPQFDLFIDVVFPELKKRKSTDRKLRFWSAGCSKGQEAYSIAMAVLKNLEVPDAWDLLIHASDISRRMLESAEKGAYTEIEMQTLNPVMQRQYFEKIDGSYIIKPRVKKVIAFDFHNLKHENGLRELDAIFCRNVMIYFDRNEQKRLIEKFHKSLIPGGYLFLGHAETVQGLSDGFRFIFQNKAAVYQKTA